MHEVTKKAPSLKVMGAYPRTMSDFPEQGNCTLVFVLRLFILPLLWLFLILTLEKMGE